MAHDAIPLKLHTIANETGYQLEYRRTVRRGGWPTPSQKPFGLYYSDGSHCASYATLAALENALRARAGC